jgi:predicted transcriptional regulator
MAREIPSLGELEIRVLRLVWRRQPCTEREVTEEVQAERPVVRTTVLRVLQRLEAKGLLRREPGDGPVRFRAAVEERRVLPALIRRFIDGVLGGSSGPLVAYLAESERLSAEDLEALRAIARKLGPDAGRAKGD